MLDLTSALGLAAANATFVLANHFLLAVVVKLARNQSFAESGLFGFLTLFLDFTVLSMGTVTGIDLAGQPVCIPAEHPAPLSTLSSPARAPALMRQLLEMKKKNNSQPDGFPSHSQ